MPRKRHIHKAPQDPAVLTPANAEQTDTVFTIPELAARWRTSRHTITVAIRAGRLQAFRIGHRVYRIREAEVVRYENEHMSAQSEVA